MQCAPKSVRVFQRLISKQYIETDLGVGVVHDVFSNGATLQSTTSVGDDLLARAICREEMGLRGEGLAKGPSAWHADGSTWLHCGYSIGSHRA